MKQNCMPVNYKTLWLTGSGTKVVSFIDHNYLKRTQKVKLTSYWPQGDYQGSVVGS